MCPVLHVWLNGWTSKQHQTNWDKKCILLGMTWVFKQNSLRFAFRDLNNTFELFAYFYFNYSLGLQRARDLCVFIIGVLCNIYVFFFQIGDGVIRSLLQPGCTVKMYVIEKSSNGLAIMERGIVHFQYTC
jgi:hypothetical protein